MPDDFACDPPLRSKHFKATRRNKQCLRYQPIAPGISLSDLGTVAAGKSADFFVLDASPLDEIANTSTRSIFAAKKFRVPPCR
jgi:imidazolonepropionase-like amidohydrolase